MLTQQALLKSLAPFKYWAVTYLHLPARLLLLQPRTWVAFWPATPPHTVLTQQHPQQGPRSMICVINCPGKYEVSTATHFNMPLSCEKKWDAKNFCSFWAIIILNIQARETNFSK